MTLEVQKGPLGAFQKGASELGGLLQGSLWEGGFSWTKNGVWLKLQSRWPGMDGGGEGVRGAQAAACSVNLRIDLGWALLLSGATEETGCHVHECSEGARGPGVSLSTARRC